MQQQEVQRTGLPSVSVFQTGFEAAKQALWLQARRGWSEWFGRVLWDHFVTLTFAHPHGPEASLRQFKRWVRRLEQRAQQGVCWAYVLERGAAGLWHLHVLLWGTSHVPNKGLEEAWPCGRADASMYDPRRGATYYVTKAVGTDVVEYDFDYRHLPFSRN